MDTTGASGSSGTPFTVEKSPLDFADEDLPSPNTEGVGTEEQIHDELSREIPPVGHATTAEVVPETGLKEEVATMGPPPSHSSYRGKSLATMSLGAGSISSTPSAQGVPTAVKAKNAELTKELESLRITGEEKIKAAFEEFKKYEDARVEQRCAEMYARLDALSIYFDEELYPHMLTAISGRRWVIEHGIRLAVMKCAESTKLRHVFANVVSAGIAKGMSEGLGYGIKHEKAD
ncbi:hypothetical protein Tco_0309863 [Tanacetum coccineum]